LLLAVAASHAWEVEMDYVHPATHNGVKGVEVDRIDVQGPGTFRDALSGLTGSALNLAFKDCGDSSTHAKVTDVSPKSITLGDKTTITGTGTLDEDITDGTYTMTMTGVGGIKLLSCSGDASKAQECPVKVLGFKVGTLSFEGVQFPVKKGTISGIPKVTISLPASLPKLAVATTTHLTVNTKSGDKVICVDINTSAAEQSSTEHQAQHQQAVKPGFFTQMRQRLAEVPLPGLFVAFACLLWLFAAIVGRRSKGNALEDQYGAVHAGSEMQL